MTISRRAGALLLAGAVVLIIVATLLPDMHSNTARGTDAPWCWLCGDTGTSDATLNLALFMPLGAALALLGISTRRAMLAGMVLSLAIEGTQFAGWPPTRVASVTDFMANSLGALIGALVASHWRVWARPTAERARLLLLLGVIGFASILGLTSWALGRTRSDIGVTQAWVQLTDPVWGYGWYQGTVHRAEAFRANGSQQVFGNTSAGPVHLEGALRSIDTVRVRVSGRDARRQLVPFFAVRQMGPRPSLLLGQDGPDARLRVRLRASRLRLASPDLVLRNAFPENVVDERVFQAAIAPTGFALHVRTNEGIQSSTLRLSLSMGWTLLQTVVGAEDRSAHVLSFVWLMVIIFPLGFWMAHLTRRDRPWGALSIAVLVTMAVLAPRAGGIASLAWSEWCALAIGFALGTGLRISVKNASPNPL